jgi:hypothetical protein
MSGRDEYRKKAEECREGALETRAPEDKAAWLSMAEDWLRLATFDETGQTQGECRSSN